MTEPELVFIVNPRSGGHAGARLLADLQARFGSERAVALQGLDLTAWVGHWHGRVAAMVACGGDGTVAALLDATWKVAPRTPTTVGILPLGTGNDLARFAGVPLHAGLPWRLAWLQAARGMPLDRWQLTAPDGTARAFFNYCSFGGDARVTYRFHELRRQHARWFRSRMCNLAGYALAGLQEAPPALALAGGGENGNALPVPHWLRTLAVLNIPSYAGGRHLGPGRVADGHLETYALPGGLALGLALSGLRWPRRLGHHRQLSVRLGRAGLLQVDGEPLRAPAGWWRITAAGQVRLLTAGAATGTV